MPMINGFFTGDIQPTSTVGGCIDIFKNLWPNPEDTIKMIDDACNRNASYWEKASTIGLGVRQTHRLNKLLMLTHHADISGDPALQNIHNQFYAMLLATSIPHATRYDINESLWHEPYSILKYEEGDQYKSHYDGGTAIGRAISAICYLNDNFDGGELEFVNFGIKFKPEPGTLILFPSNYAYRHVAHPVTNGTKYALVTWIRDREM